MIQIRIIGIRKPGGATNYHSAISHYKWQDQSGQTGIWERMVMVNWLLADTNGRRAYVLDRVGNVAYCKVVKNQNGTMFLETYPDSTRADNLLSLPLC